jgi:hypothetical protein
MSDENNQDPHVEPDGLPGHDVWAPQELTEPSPDDLTTRFVEPTAHPPTAHPNVAPTGYEPASYQAPGYEPAVASQPVGSWR